MEIRSYVLNPLEAKMLNFLFYFPRAGEFGCYPATAIQNSQILGTAKIAEKLVVKGKKTILELNSLKDILQSGNIKDIKDFLMTKNLINTNIF